MTVLVDSDILVEICRGRDEEIGSRWINLSRSESTILYSPLTAAELWAGALPQENRLLTALFQALECVYADSDTGRIAGDFLRKYRKSHGMGLGDALIAAAAVRNNAALWTRNRKHYPMKGLVFY